MSAGRARATNRGWRKQGVSSVTPDRVVDELNQRVLGDLQACRHVWEHGGDPVAIVEAVRQVDIPEWLADALLLFLIATTPGDDEKDPLSPLSRASRQMLHRLWRERTRDSVDRERAVLFAAVRTIAASDPPNSPTWDQAARIADGISRLNYPTLPHVGTKAIEASYARVRRGLEDPSRYYRAGANLFDRAISAYERLVQTMSRAAKVPNAKRCLNRNT